VSARSSRVPPQVAPATAPGHVPLASAAAASGALVYAFGVHESSYGQVGETAPVETMRALAKALVATAMATTAKPKFGK